MADFNALEALINAHIKKNGVQAITGNILNGILRGMVSALGKGYTIAGVAVPSSDPGTMTGPLAYLAYTAGTYTHFGGLEVGQGEVAMLIYNEAVWHKEVLFSLAASATIDGNVGTPEVGVSFVDGLLTFDFRNMKGNPGDAAGFGTINATVDGNVGTPGVSVQSSGPDTAKNITFQFTNLKGETGVTSVVATVDNTVGTPTCTVSLVGQQLTLAFSGLKGAQGDTGSSVDYPFTIVNNLTTNDATQALSAAMGVQLEAEVSQLEAEVNGKPKNYSEGHYLKQDGTIGDNTLWGVTDFIPYTPGNSVTWKFHSEYHNYYLGFFNENKEYISGSDFSAQYNAQVGGRLISASDINRFAPGAAYVRASFNLSYSNAEVLVGDTSAWTPMGAIPSLQQQIDGITDDVEELDEKVDLSVQCLPQTFTSEEQATARENIGVGNALYGRKKNYFEDGRISEGKILYLDGVGTTDFIPYTPGTEIVWNFGGTGESIIRIESYDSNKNFLAYYSSNEYTDTRTISFSNNNPAFIRASFHLQIDGAVNQTPVKIGGIDFVIHDAESGYTGFIESGVLEDERKWKPLPLGGLLNCDTNSAGHLNHNPTYDPIRVTTKSNICVPFPGMRIRHKIPDGLPYILTGYWWVGTSDGNHSTLSGGSAAFVNGGEITLPVTALCIRPVFRAYTTVSGAYSEPISASDIQTLIDNGKLAIEYYDERGEDVVGRNEATQINLQALRRVFIPGGGASNGMDSMPVFAHITDIHGDAPRWKNFLEYCDHFGVDFILETGDAVLYQKQDASQFIYDFANEHNTDVIACIGNHESLPTGSSTLFADNLSDLATKYEYLASAGTTTTKCYFYKDYDAKKVRVIVLNQHEDGVYRRRIGQAQVDWLIATLLSTPVGYGIVIAYHAPEDKVVAESPYDVFRQPVPNTGASYEPNGAYVDKRVVELLVDAFISRTSVNFTYEDHSATYNGDSDVTTQTVSVVADFSEVDETTEFICYVCGHRHEDWIGHYDNSTNKQLCLCITCGNALYGDSTNPAWANQSDLPRGGVGVSQDAFCIYAIDRLNGNVKVMRVGATVTQMMVKREMMVIPYKD